MEDAADVVVVGAGSAGAIVAARLSENPRLRVLLVEAGSDPYAAGSPPPDMLDTFPGSFFNPAYFWGGMQHMMVMQAKVMGGGSSVMGMWAQRGVPSDFDGWRESGATGWGWDDVLPSFKKLERDLDYGGPEHGTAGPVPIRRVKFEDWPGYAQAIGRAAMKRGLPLREDLTGDYSDGVFPMPLANSLDEGRVSSARGWLTPEVRKRPNLRIMADTRVLRLKMDGSRVAGVVVSRGGGPASEIAADKVVLSGGAIMTPVVLQRSGIGREDLRAAGIDPVVDLPGVGRQLQNHTLITFGTVVPRAARQKKEMRTYGLAGVRMSSGLPGMPPGDMQLHILARTSPFPHGLRIGLLNVAIYRPYSRGTVALKTADPDAVPAVDFNVLSDPRDRERMLNALKFTLGILAEPEVKAARGPLVGIVPTALMRRVNAPTLRNRLLTPFLSAILDTPVSGRLIELLGEKIPETRLSDPQLPEDLLKYARVMAHPSGTAAMGAAGDPMAVVDPNCRVRGVGGLFVVDNSIMPSITSGNTCVPAFMIGEHGAGILKREMNA